MKTKISCPLGHECEKIVEAKDGEEAHIQRCAWYVELEGTNPQNGERINDSQCAMYWQPILMVEGNGKINQLGSAVEGYRNRTEDAVHAVRELPTRIQQVLPINVNTK